MTLLDAPPEYHEVPDADGRLGGTFCGQCSDYQPVDDEPCPHHGPATVIDDTVPMTQTDYWKLADLAEVVMKTRSATSDVILAAISHNGLIPEHLGELERWGVIGRTSGGTRVVIIHEAHVAVVKAKIVGKRGVVPAGESPFARLAMPPLSARHRRIIELVAEGTQNKAIARLLTLSVETIKSHLRNIMRDLRAVDRTHLVHISHLCGVFGGIPQPRAGA